MTTQKNTQAISSPAIVTGLRSCKDRSLSITISTPELTSTEKAAFMDLQNVNAHLVISPIEDAAPELKIDKDLKQKSQSARIRNVLFVIWDHSEKDEDFETFYRLETEKIINDLKVQLDQS